VKLLLDEMFPAAVAEGLRRRGVDAIAIQETMPLRGLPDREVFVAAQLERRCVVTENIGDFVRVEAAWRSDHDTPHCGLILVAPGAFPRHHRRVVGQLVDALTTAAETESAEVGTVTWLQAERR
jgi:predicted nuclease of predicted toxin-antitoxin system